MKRLLRLSIATLLIVSYVVGHGLIVSNNVGPPVRVVHAEGSPDNDQDEESNSPVDPVPREPGEEADPGSSYEGEEDPEPGTPEPPEESEQQPGDEPSFPPGEEGPGDPPESSVGDEQEPEDEPQTPSEGEQDPEQDPSESPAPDQHEPEDPAGVPGQDGDLEGDPEGDSEAPSLTHEILGQSVTLLGEPDIVFYGWWLGNEGAIHPGNSHCYPVEASFASSTDVDSIEFEWSDDGINWSPVGPDMIEFDWGLEHDDEVWYRLVELDLTSWLDGTYYFRATAANEMDQCLSVAAEVLKESVFFRFWTWWIPDDVHLNNVSSFWVEADFFSSTDIDSIEFEWSADGINWNQVEETVEDSGVEYIEGGFCFWRRYVTLDLTSWPDGTYYFRATATNESGQHCVSEVAEVLKEIAYIRLQRWDLGHEDEGLINIENAGCFYVNVEFTSLADIDSIEFEVSSDGSNWTPIDEETIHRDSDVAKSHSRWYREFEIDATSWPEGIIYLKVTATDREERSLSEQVEIFKDTVPPEDVTNFIVEPNAEADALVLNWTNPEDFEFVRVQRGYGYYYEDYYWETLVETTENSYVDEDVWSGDTYEYRIVVFDEIGNASPNPATATCTLPIPPLRLIDWFNTDVVYSGNQEEFRIRTRFQAQAVLVSIDYYFSADGLSWEEISQYSGLSIVSDSGLEYEWDTYWTRALVVDLSGFPDGNYWLKAAAENTNGLTLDAILELTKDTVCADAENLTVTPNEDNTALVLTWTIPDPDDFDYADIYRYNYQRDVWDCIAWSVEEDTYVDTDIDPSNVYLYYRYRVVLVDKAYNESQNPPEASGKLHGESLMALKSWEVTNQGKINSGNAQNYSIRIDFYSSNPISNVDFNYKTAGGDWESLSPFMPYTYSVMYDEATASGYKGIRVDVSGPWGIPDGEIFLQAVITDTAGNTLIEEHELVKDTVPPAGVSGLTVNPNEEGTALVLSWTNPTEDFSHVVLRRDSTVLSSQFAGEAYTDDNALPGVSYTYRVTAVDAAGNTKPVEITAVLPTSQGPVLVSMSPEDGFLTRADSVSYEADFRCDKKVVNILFEVSLDGEVWEPLNPLTTSPSYSSVSDYYWVSGMWDIRVIGEEEYLIRATALDASGRSTAVTRTVCVDRLGPDMPADFTATVDSDSVTLSWSPLEDAVKYVLTRQPANPDDGASTSWDIHPPEYSFVDTTLDSETLYIYSLKAYDLAGNAGDSATLTAEIHDGPALNLQGGLDIYTNESQYTLRGVTEPGATVTVNGSVVVVSPEGEFSYDTELQAGEQTLRVVATLAGAQHTLEQRVVLDTTPPGIGFSSAPSDGGVVRGIVTLRFSRGSELAEGALQVTRDDGVTWEDILQIPPEFSVLQDFFWDSTAPVGESGPLEDGSYKFRVMARDRAGNVGFSGIRIWIVQNTPPPAPRDLAAVGGVDTIHLSWLANVEPVSWYRVYRSVLPGGPYARVAEISASSSEPTKYVDQDVESGTMYYYVVTAGVGSAYQGELESAFSGEVPAVPLDDTTPPTISAIPFTEGETYGRGMLSFGGGSRLAATDNSHRGVKEFIFAFSCDGGVTWETLVCPAKSYPAGTSNYSTRDTIWTLEQTQDLEPGLYLLRFSAVDQAGNVSEPQVRNIIIAGDPPAPQNLKVTRGEGSLILTWDPVEEDGFQYYTVHRSTYLTGGFAQLGLSIHQRDNTTYTDTTAVEMGKTYYYYVVHHNSLGTAQSAIVSGTPSDDLTPPVVTEVSRFSGAGGPQLIFQAHATDNKAVSTMRAFYSLDNGATWEDMDYTISLSTTSSGKWATFTWDTKDLPENPALNVGVRVVAFDAAGNESEPVDAFWTLDLWVSPATNLRTTPGEGTILLEWDASPDGDIDRYRILRGLQSGGPYYNPGGLEKYTTDTQFYDESCVPNTVYYYVVDTSDRFGNVKRSDEVSGTTISDTEPPYIIGVGPEHGVTIGGDITVFLFVYFRDNSGPEGCKARIEYKDAEGNWIQIGPVLTNPHAVQGTDYHDLNTGWNLRDIETGDYMVRYTVYDAADNASQIEVTYHVDRTPPGAPENLEAVYGLGQIGLAWEPPLDGDVARYRIYRANDESGEYTYVDEVEGRDTASYSDTTVESGLTYFYYVTAVDRYGHEGPPSNIESAKAEADTWPPEVLGIAPGSDVSIGPNTPITVTATDNIRVVSITLEYSLDGETWNEITTKPTPAGELVEAVFYWDDAPSLNCDGPVKIRAVARDRSSNVSDEDDENAVRDYILDTVGPNVTGLSYIASNVEVILTWDPVTDEDFSHYVIECEDLHYHETDYTAGHRVSGLSPGLVSRFTVTAYDSLGNPGVPGEVVATTQLDVLPPVFSTPPAHSQYNYQAVLRLYQAAWDNVGVDTFTFEYSIDGSTWEELGTVGGTGGLSDAYGRRSTGVYEWDVSGLPEGSYFVRAFAIDGAGNRSEYSQVVEYIVDWTPPGVPTGFKATATSGFVELEWDKPTEDDVEQYRVYRAPSEDGPYEVLESRVLYLSYRDRRAVPGETYFYKLTVLDVAGNESEAAGPVVASLALDTMPPYVAFMRPWSPTANIYLHKDIGVLTRFDVRAIDDRLLDSITLEYREAGAGEDAWRLIGEYTADEDTYDAQAPFLWDASGLTSGEYEFRVILTDRSGNVSDPYIASYNVHVEVPGTPHLTATPGGWRVDLSWYCDEGSEPVGYRVFRATSAIGPYSRIATVAGNSFSDFPLALGKTYYYYVEAVDAYRNLTRSETVSAIPTDEDAYPPTADAGDDLIVPFGFEAIFDGTYSADNHRIESYLWDFGDGNTSPMAQPRHIYEELGTYTVILTVTDPAGNSAQDTCEVKVVSPDQVGTLEVRVIDNVSGTPLPGASVVIQYADGVTQHSTSDSMGIARVVAPPGEYRVYAYIQKYKPAGVDATIVRNQKTSTYVRLNRGEVVEGEIKVTRMTLDEIIAAGVDISAPENQHVWKFQINLGFKTWEVAVNSSGGGADTLGGGGGYSSGLTEFGYSAEGQTVEIEFIPPPEPGIPPSIAYLVIPGEAKWLKEFFEVGLIIENTADPEFVIDEAMAHLNLPKGLALAPTRIPQNVQMDMGSIAGGEKKEVQWIIRGDEKGEYDLAAEFEGILQPFCEPLKKIFRTKRPFRVWGEDALFMHIYAQDGADIGYPYNLTLEMENVSDAPVYNLSLALLEDAKQNYIYAPNQELLASIIELPPGERLRKEYQLIPSIEGELEVEASYVLQVGGNANVKSSVYSVSVPENARGTAPVLTQENSGGEVNLSWDPAEDAEGYRVYYIRDDLRISMDPELVYTCGPEVTQVTLPELDGPKDYVLMTVIGGRERLFHGINGLSWIDKAAPAVLTVDPAEILVGRETELIITVRKGGLPIESGYVDVGDLELGCVLDQYGQTRVVVNPGVPGPIVVSVYGSEELIVSKTITAVMPAPPAKPMGLKAKDEVGKVLLTWFANSEPDLAGYEVYQIVDNAWQRINPELVLETSYLVTDLKYETSYIFMVKAVSELGMSSESSDPVEILLKIAPDEVGPWVISTTPANNQAGVAVNTAIIVNFSEDITLDVAYEGIEVKVNDQSWEYELEIIGNSLVLTLGQLLPHKALCEVFIPEEAIRQAGAWNPMAHDCAFAFYTGMEPDETPPHLTAVYPAGNQNDIPVNAQITISFSEDIVLGSNYEAISLNAGGEARAFSTEVSRNVLTLKPVEDLPYSVLCEVSIPVGAVVDAAGNSLPEGYSFRFFTGLAPDNTPPSVVAIVPADNSPDVPLNAEINVYFSEDLGQGATLQGVEVYAGEGLVGYTYTTSDNVLTLKPVALLPQTERCRVVLPAGAVCDAAGNPTESEYEFEFSTGLHADYDAPFVQNPEPLGDAIRFSFSETVQQGPDLSDISLLVDGEVAEFVMEVSGKELILTASDQQFEGDWEITIPERAVKDVSGNFLEEPFMFAPMKDAASADHVWEKTFGGDGLDEAWAVVETEDGGYVFTGTYWDKHVAEDGSETGEEKVWLVKVDSDGNLVWERKYGGGFHEAGRDVAVWSDSEFKGFIITGIHRATIDSNEQIWLVKTDELGHSSAGFEWIHRLEGTEYESAKKQAFAVTQTWEGNYVIAGSFVTGNGSVPFAIWTDSMGQVGEIKTYDTPGWGAFYAVEETVEKVKDENGEETEVHGLIFAGYGGDGTGRRNGLVVKTNAYGRVEWQHRFTSKESSVARDVKQTKDGYIVVGYTGTRMYLLKLDKAGKVVKQQTVGDGFGYSVAVTKDGGFIAAGKDSKGIYVVKTNADLKTDWEKHFGGSFSEAYSVIPTKDECFVVTGLRSDDDVFLLKFEGEKKRNLNVSSPNVFLDGTVLVYASVFDELGKLITSGEPDVEIEVTGYDERLELNDAGEDGDFHPEDGVHSAWVHLSRVGEVEIKLYVDGHDAKKSITVNVIDTTPLPLVVVTDLEALYREFRNTGMSPTVDSNKNKIPDYYDLLDRLNKYAANHGGIVVDIRQEVTAENMFYPYSSLEYPESISMQRYEGPIQITETTTLKYVAKDRYNNWSRQSVETYKIVDSAEVAPQAVAFPKGGKFRTQLNVELIPSHPEAEIYFTTDGKEPTEESTKYEGPIYVGKTTTLKYVVKLGEKTSKVAKEEYNIDTIWGPLVPYVSAVPGSGTYAGPVWVTLKASDGAEIYYTTDGSGLIADRKKMGELVDEYLGWLGLRTAFRNLAIIGDDFVVPYYRLESPAPSMKEATYAVPKDYGNPTLIDTGQGYVMTDVPYGMYWDPGAPEDIKRPELDAGVGRVFAQRPANLIQIIDGYEMPVQRSNAVVFSLGDETPKPKPEAPDPKPPDSGFSAPGSPAPAPRGSEPPESPITMTAGEPKVEEGKVTLAITTNNTGDAYENARYGVKVNVPGAKGDSLEISYGEEETFSLTRAEDSDDFVGYFGPEEGFAIEEGWDETTEFTVDFGTSTEDRKITVDAWIGTAPEPNPEEAVATMKQVTITIPGIEPPPPPPPPPTGGREGGVNWPLAVRTALIPVLEQAFERKGEIKNPVDYALDRYYHFDGASMDWKAEDVASALANAHITLLWTTASHKDANTKGSAKLAPKDIDKGGGAPGHVLISTGSHMGYSVANFSTEGDLTPYKTNFVKSILEKKVTFIAPTTYSAGGEPALAYHDLLLSSFLANLVLYGNPGVTTIGDVQVLAYREYWERAASPYGDDISTYGAYGIALYGLPTQPLAGQNLPKRTPKPPYEPQFQGQEGFSPISMMSMGLAGPEGSDSGDAANLGSVDSLGEEGVFFTQQSTGTEGLSVVVDIPNFKVSSQPDGRTLIEIPNGAAFLVNAHAPMVPLVTKSFILPAGAQVSDVHFVATDTMVIQDVDLAEFTPVNRELGPVEGTYEVPNPYPQEMCWWQTTEDRGGTRLDISIVPVRYDPVAREATLFHHMEIDVSFTGPRSGTDIESVTVNNGQPLQTGMEEVPVEVRVLSSVEEEVTLAWSVRDAGGLVLESGMESIELVAGSNIIPFTMNTMDWTPGYKTFTVYASGLGVLDSFHVELFIRGLNLEAALSQGSYLPTDETAEMTALVYDESGFPVVGLGPESFGLEIDGQPPSGELTVIEDGAGRYTLTFPLSGVSEAAHYADLTCQDDRGYVRTVTVQFVVATDSTPPVVVETYPENEEAGTDSRVTIAVRFSENVVEGPSLVDTAIEGGGADVPFDYDIIGDTLILTPQGELEKATVYRVTIPADAVQDESGNGLLYDYVFEFVTWIEPDTTSPVLVSTEPVEGAVDKPATARVWFAFSETITLADPEGVTWVTEDGVGIEFNVIVNGEDLILVPIDAAPYGATTTVTVLKEAITDQSGNHLESDLALSYTVETGPDEGAPEIVQVIPHDGCMGVLPSTLVTIRFGEPVVEGANFQLVTWREEGGQDVASSADVKRDTLTLTPTEPLALGKTYTVTIPAGTVTDLAGNELAHGIEFSFTTRFAADTIPPRIEETIPADEGKGVLPNARVYIYFDEAIRASHGFDGVSLSAGESAVSFDAEVSGRTLILTPAELLGYNTEYTVVILAGTVQDLEGNPLAEGCVFTFTTGHTPDTTGPSVSRFEPGEDDAPVDAVIKVHFSEFIKPGSSFDDITVSGGAAGDILCVAEIDGQTLTLTPSMLEFSTTYTVFIPAGAVTDIAGNGCAETTYQFTTAESPAVPVITMTAGEATVADGKVTLSITTKNTGAAYDNARYGVRVNVSGVEGNSIIASYGEGDTFSLNREGVSDDFVGYFEPEDGFTITEGWNVTTVFTVDFGTSSVERTVKVDAWVGKAPEPTMEEALAAMNRVTITIPAEAIPPLTVSATPAGGTYSSARTVTLVASDPGAEIFYTADGSDPDENSLRYTGPIAVSKTTTLKFRARDAEGRWSDIYTCAYTITTTPSDGGSGGGVATPEPETPPEPLEPETPVFPDTVEHWAKKEIEHLASLSIVDGYPGGQFEPDKEITRAEFAKMFALVIGFPAGTGSRQYSDIAGHWAEEYILMTDWLGYPDGTFQPDRPISREEIAVLVARQMDLEGGTLDFRDAEAIREWAHSAVAALVLHDIIQGYPDGTFRPLNNVTRAEACVLIYRLMDWLAGWGA